MLLRKYEENKHALSLIGIEALDERRRLGLPIFSEQLQQEQEFLIKKENEMSRAFTFDGRPQPLMTDFKTAELRAEALRRLYPENRYEVVPGGNLWRIAQQDQDGNFVEWVTS